LSAANRVIAFNTPFIRWIRGESANAIDFGRDDLLRPASLSDVPQAGGARRLRRFTVQKNQVLQAFQQFPPKQR
jgi:hypothetical protein